MCDSKDVTTLLFNPDIIDTNAAQLQCLFCLLFKWKILAQHVRSEVTCLFLDEQTSVATLLVALCMRDYQVVYRPGEEPADGLCPVQECRLEVERCVPLFTPGGRR